MRKYWIHIHCITLLSEKERLWKKRPSLNLIKEYLDSSGNLFRKLLKH